MLFPLPIRVSGARAPAALPLANAGLIAANVAGTLFLNRDLWQISRDTGLMTVATYSFIHAGLLHLLLNMWALWVFGNAVNRRMGDAGYVAAYLGVVVAVGLAAQFLTDGPVLGSACGVFGVAAMAVWLAPRARVLFFLLAIFPLTLLIGLFRRPIQPIGWFVRWGWLEIALLWGLLLVPLLEIIGYLASLRWDNAHLVHLLGFVAGTIAVLLVPRHPPGAPEPPGPPEPPRETRVEVLTVPRSDVREPDASQPSPAGAQEREQRELRSGGDRQ